MKGQVQKFQNGFSFLSNTKRYRVPHSCVRRPLMLCRQSSACTVAYKRDKLWFISLPNKEPSFVTPLEAPCYVTSLLRSSYQRKCQSRRHQTKKCVSTSNHRSRFLATVGAISAHPNVQRGQGDIAVPRKIAPRYICIIPK